MPGKGDPLMKILNQLMHEMHALLRQEVL